MYSFFFFVTINDSHCNLNSKVILYADETSLQVFNQNEKVFLQSIQAAQKKAFGWFSSDKLLANPENPYQLILGLSQKTQTHSVKLLGM